MPPMSANTPEPRYAIYFVPDPETELYRFGASVLGYDAYTGNDTSFISSAAPDWLDKIREPRTYGFHATLKPPFRLTADAVASDLEKALDAFAKSHRQIDVGPLEVRSLGSFIALVPAVPCSPLDQLAGACVQHFDDFRAPMNVEERARRLATSLSEQERINLDRWGYPYVFDNFRFHMTLTGPLVDADRAQTLKWLITEFASRTAAQRLILDRLVVAHQTDGSFRVVHSVPVGP
jgi:putative phosphonate metabolism protein